MIASADVRELAPDELNQITGGGLDCSAGPAPVLSALIVTAAVATIGAAVGVAIGHAIKGDE